MEASSKNPISGIFISQNYGLSVRIDFGGCGW
jgi:hypothetical protein